MFDLKRTCSTSVRLLKYTWYLVYSLMATNIKFHWSSRTAEGKAMANFSAATAEPKAKAKTKC